MFEYIARKTSSVVFACFFVDLGPITFAPVGRPRASVSEVPVPNMILLDGMSYEIRGRLIQDEDRAVFASQVVEVQHATMVDIVPNALVSIRVEKETVESKTFPRNVDPRYSEGIEANQGNHFLFSSGPDRWIVMAVPSTIVDCEMLVS
jgi:hypothetical protein